MSINKATIWTSDYGDIRLPADFPIHILRKNGWWDMRFTSLRVKWKAWIAAEEAKLIPNRLHGAVINALIPNRLHGAVINAEGDAI